MLWDCFWGHFWPKAAQQFSMLSVHLRMYDSNLYRDVHMPCSGCCWRVQTSEFPVAEYYIGLLNLGRGHNIAKLDTRAPGSLWYAARLKTSWPGQWLRYLAAVVSICEYMVSNKGGLPCHYHDYGRSWGLCPHALYFVGATTPGSATYGLGMRLVVVL